MINKLKIAVFDFDGTLAEKGTTTWFKLREIKDLDEKSIRWHKYMYQKFKTGRISYDEWCQVTVRLFRFNGITKSDLEKVSRETKLIDGANKTFRRLKEEGYCLHILSGGVKEAIEQILGYNVRYFDSIQANSFIFDDDGLISGIKTTKYDYEGKPEFIKKLISYYRVSPEDIIFFGNGENDDFAHRAGCKTLCINPDGADSTNRTKWCDSINNLTDLTQILKLIGIDDEKEKTVL